MAQEMDLIVRIVNKDLDGRQTVARALTDIKGIGTRMGGMIAKQLEKETGFSLKEKIGYIGEKEKKVLEDIIENPLKHNLKEHHLNRRKDIESGEPKHNVMGEWDFTLRQDRQREGKTKSYRGLRHTWGVTVRGQKTKSTHRKRGGIVGVIKKDKR